MPLGQPQRLLVHRVNIPDLLSNLIDQHQLVQVPGIDAGDPVDLLQIGSGKQCLLDLIDPLGGGGCHLLQQPGDILGTLISGRILGVTTRSLASEVKTEL